MDIWLNYSLHGFPVLSLKHKYLNKCLLKSIDSIASLIQFVWKDKQFPNNYWKQFLTISKQSLKHFEVFLNFNCGFHKAAQSRQR